MKVRTLNPKIIAALAVSALVAAGGAAAAKRAQQTFSRDQLPPGFAIGSADPSLGLKVALADGKVASVAPADAATANVRATRSGEGNQTMLTVRTDLDVAVKFDMYISADGQVFKYTSSCAITPGISSFEAWQSPVREFAIGNPRVVSEKNLSCD